MWSFLMFFVIIAFMGYALSKNNSPSQVQIDGLPKLAKTLHLSHQKENKEEGLTERLIGTKGGFELQLNFHYEQISPEEAQLITNIKIDLGIWTYYSYIIQPEYYLEEKSFDHLFKLKSNDSLFSQESISTEIQNALVKHYQMLKMGPIKVNEGVLSFSRAQLLEQENREELIALLDFLPQIAQLFHKYIQQISLRFPNYMQLAEKLEMKNIIEKKNPAFNLIKDKISEIPLLLFERNFENGKKLLLYLKRTSSGYETCFLLQLPDHKGFDLSISSDQNRTWVGQMIKGQDIVINDEEFDQAFIIQSPDPLKTKQLLMFQVFREALLKLVAHVNHWQMKSKEISFITTFNLVKYTSEEDLFDMKNIIEHSITVTKSL